MALRNGVHDQFIALCAVMSGIAMYDAAGESLDESTNVEDTFIENFNFEGVCVCVSVCTFCFCAPCNFFSHSIEILRERN